MKFASHFKNNTLINFPYFNIIIKKRYITDCEKTKITLIHRSEELIIKYQKSIANP